MRIVPRIPTIALWLLAALALIASLGLSTPVAAQEGETEGGYIYVVQPGDNWTVVARRVGLTVEELQAANPQAVRRTGWLIVGERLFIPAPAGSQEQIYIVQPGDGWTTIAAQFDVSVRLLKAVNPRSVRPGDILYVGERLVIPPRPQPGPTPGTAMPAAVASPTVLITPSPAATSPTVTPTALSPTATPSPTPTPTPTPAPGPRALLPACPDAFEDFPQILAQIAAMPSQDDFQPLTEYLDMCGLALVQDPVVQDLTGDDRADQVLVYQEKAEESDVPFHPRSDLVVLEATAEGYRVSFHAGAAGQVTLLAAADVNQDGAADLVFTDTTCGAHTCFTSVYVMSWTGGSWEDWTAGTITMASVEVSLEDVDDAGQGKELVLKGGIINSVGAGPQRERTEVWASVDGQPYSLLRQVLAPSPCLYHAILDAEKALVEDQDLAAAAALFQAALSNPNLEACWIRTNELEELRSFAHFRLALIAAYQGDLAGAAAHVAQIQETYPEQPFAPLAALWLQTLQESGDPQAACQTVTDYLATENNAAVEALADYGYANPTFRTEDICPLLPELEPSVPEQVTPAPTEAPAEEEAQAPTATPTPAEVGLTGLDSLDVDLPECPDTVPGFAQTLPQVVALAEGDPLVIEAWMRVCNALTDERGALLFYDLNQDGRSDVLAFPTLVSDAGYGPGGAEGTLMILHAQADGSYTTIYSPDVFGLPTPLAVGDANMDGQDELIWKLESCSTFCVTAVEVLRWDEESQGYVSWIEPGAALAEGQAFLEPVPEGDPGRGRQIRLVGGVSGTPGGGLQIAHEEIWQSVDGAPFRRIRWQYDREAEAASCLGLRLVEADVLLQAADVLGYAPAIQAYREALSDESLRPCSVYEMDPEEERALLRGLAAFRLIQAQALSGDLAGAQATLAALQDEQEDSLYAQAAASWLEAYTQDSDPAAACEPVSELAEKQPKMWQITDQYGFDHPALAAVQICFVPREGE